MAFGVRTQAQPTECETVTLAIWWEQGPWPQVLPIQLIQLTAGRLNYCYIIVMVGLRTESGILLFAVAWQWGLSPLDVAFLFTISRLSSPCH